MPAPNSPGTPSQRKSRHEASDGDSNSRAVAAATAMADGSEEQPPRVPIRVGEAWSETDVLDDGVSQGQRGFMVGSKGTESQLQGKAGPEKMFLSRKTGHIRFLCSRRRAAPC